MSDSAEHHQILISTDGHCGADLGDYKPYLESKYHEEFDAWVGTFHEAWADDIDQDRPANHRVGVASANAPLNWDADLRLEHLDDRGIPLVCSRHLDLAVGLSTNSDSPACVYSWIWPRFSSRRPSEVPQASRENVFVSATQAIDRMRAARCPWVRAVAV
jgi:hypothetical protein